MISPEQWEEEFKERIELAGYKYFPAHVCHCEDGTSLHWWFHKREVYAYLLPDGKIEVTKIWGPNIIEEMEDVDDYDHDTHAISIWTWLHEEI